jgi:putative pyoverdin transport system ATP-binding/permease protein
MSGLLKLVSFLVRESGQRRFSWSSLSALIAAGIVAGFASTGLLATINSALGRNGPRSSLVWVFAGLCVVLPLARIASQFFLLRLSEGLTFHLRMQLSAKILASPLRRLEQVGPARLMATLTEDVTTITNALSSIPLFCLHSAVVASCLVYLGWLSWQLLIIVIVSIAVGTFSYRLPVTKALWHLRFGRERRDDLLLHYRGLTEGTKELKIHRSRREAFLSKLLEPTAASLREHNVVGGMIYAVANSCGQVLFFLVIGLILFVAPRFMELSNKVLSGYMLGILYMLTPLDLILGLFPVFSRAAVSVDKIEKLGLSLTGGTSDDDSALVVGSQWTELKVVEVTHAFYREDKDATFTLGPVSLDLTPGELVFIIGGNGSGKTTFAKLLIGLYAPEAGQIRLDGESVNDHNRDSYRQLFSVVFSDFFLFDKLIGLERPELDARAREYLVQFQLDQKLRVEDGTLSTIDLSQGQRKRLALLTAYLEDRQIYVFDEWAADQDPHFKQIFYLDLVPELRRRGKTVLVISHDDHYYSMADRIVKLDYGKLAFDGAAEEYLRSVGKKQSLREASDFVESS